MQPHIVFTLHGMGQHSAGWSREGITQFVEMARTIGYPQPSLESLEFVEINYNHLFDDYLAQHNKQAKTLPEFIENSASIGRSSFYKGLYDYAGSVQDEDDFVVNALGDVFLYRVTLYEQTVISFVQDKIVSTLNSAGRNISWSLIGHSLGTRVMQDAIEVLLKDTDIINRFGKPLCIAMIANVCHLLAYNPAELWRDSTVYPNETRNIGCLRYVNACHPLDPFMWVRPFIPPSQWGIGAAVKPGFLNAAILSSDLRRANPHSFAGYLENPQVTATLCQGLGTEHSTIPAFDPGKLSAAVTEYQSGSISANVRILGQKLSDLREQRSLNSFRSFVETLRDCEKLLNNLQDSLTGGDRP